MAFRKQDTSSEKPNNTSKKSAKLARKAAALLALGFAVTPLSAAKSTMVNCQFRGSNGCGNGCPSTTSQVMTLDQCRKEGGTPTPLDDE